MSKAVKKFIEELNKEHEIILGFQEYEKKIADLEAKLAESENKFIVANNLRKNSDEVLLNYKTKKYGLDKTIQELRKMKLSLPEKEWYYKGFENCERQMSSHIADLTLEVKELKQQLAEKDEEIAYLTKQVKKFNNEAQKYFEDAYCNDFHNQDKISFCIEQLEKVKETTKCILDNALKNSSLNQSYYDRLLDEIDNQIKQLKVKAERS